MFEGAITRVLDVAKSEAAAKVVVKGATAAYVYFKKDSLDPQMIAYIATAYLAVSAAIDTWWHKKHPEFAK